MKKIVIAACLLLGVNLLAECHQWDILEGFDPAQYKVVWKKDNGNYLMIDRKRTEIDKKKKIIKTWVYYINSENYKSDMRDMAIKYYLPNKDQPAYSKQYEIFNYGESMSDQVLSYSSYDCYGNETNKIVDDTARHYITQGTEQEQFVKKLMNVLGLR